MKKARGDITLHTCTKNYDQMMYGFWDMVHNIWTDGWTDGWTDRKSDIEVGAPTKKTQKQKQKYNNNKRNRGKSNNTQSSWEVTNLSISVWILLLP